MKDSVFSGQWSVISEAGSNNRLDTDNRTLITTHAFSLIEVTLALAIVAVGLIAIIGLLPQGIQASRDAADNTLAATMAQDTFSNIRAGSFADARPSLTALGFAGFAPGVPFDLGTYETSPPLSQPTPVAYFNQSGAGVDPTTAPQDCYFKVALVFKPQNPPTPAVLSVVTATVSWPAKPNMSVFLNTTTFITQIAQYQ
jgi:Tfp pilus assembly protein PilV